MTAPTPQHPGQPEGLVALAERWEQVAKRHGAYGRSQALTAYRMAARELRAALAAPSDPPQEGERYREALEEIAKLPELSRDPADDFDRGSCAARSDAADIARAALQGKA